MRRDAGISMDRGQTAERGSPARRNGLALTRGQRFLKSRYWLLLRNVIGWVLILVLFVVGPLVQGWGGSAVPDRVCAGFISREAEADGARPAGTAGGDSAGAFRIELHNGLDDGIRVDPAHCEIARSGLLTTARAASSGGHFPDNPQLHLSHVALTV